MTADEATPPPAGWLNRTAAAAEQWWRTHPSSPLVAYRTRREAIWADGPVTTSQWWEGVSNHPDPYGCFFHYKRSFYKRSFLLGLDDRHIPDFSDDDNAVLVLGPPGSNKTAGFVIPNVLFASGAVLVVSSRMDIFIATVRLRARAGDVVTYAADGTALPGAECLRFSLLQGCEDPAYRVEVAKRITTWIDRGEYALQSTQRGYPYFAQRGADLIASLMTLAIYLERDFGWILAVVRAPDFKAQVQQVAREAWDHPDQDEMLEAVRELQYLAGISAEERGNILGTVANALAAFRSERVVANSRNPNMDFDALMAGDRAAQLELSGMDEGDRGDVLSRLGIYPKVVGRYSTVYITDANADSPNALIYSEVEYRFREAMKRLSERCEREGRPRPEPLTIINDEGGVAPPTRLTSFLAERRNRNINYAICFQSLAQAEALYGTIGKDFLSLFPTVLVFPGIRHIDTLQALATLGGSFWVTTHNSGVTTGGSGGPTRSQGDGHEMAQNYLASDIAQGHIDWAGGALVLYGGAQFRWVHVQPYHRGSPWLPIIVNSLEHTIERPSRLPLPELARDGDFSNLEASGLEARFRTIVDYFTQF